MKQQTQTITQKIVHFPLIKIIIGLLLVGGTVALGQMGVAALLKSQTMDANIKMLIKGLVSALLAIGSYSLLFRFYEKRKIEELSFKGISRFLIAGIILGAGLQCLTILVIYLKGGFQVISVNPILFIIPGLVMSFVAAIFEEILVRGIVFRILQEKLGSYFALAISALIFGALHLGNPNSTMMYAIGLALQAGCFLAAAYIYSNNLWFPIAIHFAWNFTQGGIFGAAVSGNALGKSLLTTTISGEEWYTGGAFGPEGSIQATVFCLIATVVLMIAIHKEGKTIKPFWKQNHER